MVMAEKQGAIRKAGRRCCGEWRQKGLVTAAGVHLMTPHAEPRKHGDLRHAEMEWRDDPLPPPPPPPGEDGTPQPWAWVGSGWTIGIGLVVSLAMLWARAQGWM